MLDTIKGLNFPTRGQAEEELASNGHLNQGMQKALDSFYDTLTLKNGIQISLDKRARIQVRKGGKFHRKKGLERFIKKYQKQIESR